MEKSEDPRSRVRAVGEALTRLAENESLFDELSRALDAGDRSAIDRVAAGLFPAWLERAFWCFPIVILVPKKPPVISMRYYWVSTGVELTPEQLSAFKVQLAEGGTVLDLLIQQGVVRVEVKFGARGEERYVGELCVDQVHEPAY